MSDIEEGEKSPFSAQTTRRSFLKILGAAAGVALSPTSAFADTPKAILSTDTVKDKEAPWDQTTLKNKLNQAIQESLQSGEEIEIKLPEGETSIDQTIALTIPDKAKVKMTGHPNGSLLKLTGDKTLLNNYKDVDERWKARENNMFLVHMGEGSELTLNNLKVNGGSEIAGKGGYEAPPSPWDAMFLVIGKGPGEDYQPDFSMVGKRKGKFTVNGCEFDGSIAPGVVGQNLNEFNVTNLNANNVDCAAVPNWCDKVTIEHSTANNCLSDGIYIADCEDVTLTDNKVAHARQGYEFLGVSNAVIKTSDATDCGKAYCIGAAQSQDHRPSGNISILDSNTRGCLIVYSIVDVQNANIKNGRNDEVGLWMKGLSQGDFMHTGVTDLDKLLNNRGPVAFYDGANYTFEGVKVALTHDPDTRQSLTDLSNKFHNYGMLTTPGIEFIQ